MFLRIMDKKEIINAIKMRDRKKTKELIINTGIVNARDENGNYLFKNKIYRVLFEHEKEYYESIEKHIGKHLKLLEV